MLPLKAQGHLQILKRYVPFLWNTKIKSSPPVGVIPNHKDDTGSGVVVLPSCSRPRILGPPASTLSPSFCICSLKTVLMAHMVAGGRDGMMYLTCLAPQELEMPVSSLSLGSEYQWTSLCPLHPYKYCLMHGVPSKSFPQRTVHEDSTYLIAW